MISIRLAIQDEAPLCMDTKFNAPNANFILFLFCLVLFVCSIPFTSISF